MMRDILREVLDNPRRLVADLLGMACLAIVIGAWYLVGAAVLP